MYSLASFAAFTRVSVPCTGERERIHDDQRIIHDFALHQPHDLIRHTRTRMDDLEQHCNR